jgi:hypothetical protein
MIPFPFGEKCAMTIAPDPDRRGVYLAGSCGVIQSRCRVYSSNWQMHPARGCGRAATLAYTSGDMATARLHALG